MKYNQSIAHHLLKFLSGFSAVNHGILFDYIASW